MTTTGGSLWPPEPIPPAPGPVEPPYATPGYSTTAGDTAFGENASASGGDTIALGQDANATSNYATAVGQNANADGFANTALGQDASATSNYATVVGQDAGATGTQATAVGHGARATQEYQTLIAGSLATIPITPTTVLPVSGTPIAVDPNFDTMLYIPITYSPTATVAATCAISLTPQAPSNNALFATAGTYDLPTTSIPAGAVAGAVLVTTVHVPANWEVTVTVVNATIGTTTVMYM